MAGTVGYGQQEPSDSASDYNAIIFACKQLIARLSTMKLVRIEAVDTPGGVAPAGTVDVLPLVSQLDGNGNSTPHGTIYGVPYFRLQGGAHAVIIDPVVGDIGFMVVSDRDISGVKAKKAPTTPGSYRKYDAADGVYVGGILNAAPTSYIWFDDAGAITLSPDNGTTFIKLEAGKITIKAAEIVSHATVKNVWDANGNGFVYTTNTIDSYTIGAASTSHALNPPAVPS